VLENDKKIVVLDQAQEYGYCPRISTISLYWLEENNFRIFLFISTYFYFLILKSLILQIETMRM